MDTLENRTAILLASDKHDENDYFSVIKELATLSDNDERKQKYLAPLYAKVRDEIIHNSRRPVKEVKFGTSGWRGILGKDLFCKSVSQVALAIVEMYTSLEADEELWDDLGVKSFEEVKERGCILGFDNRFCGELLCSAVASVLIEAGIKVYYAGESTTGVLSAAVLQLNCAFSINLTPSHNPLEYGGLKFNAADAGPAAAEITATITRRAVEIISSDISPPGYQHGVELHIDENDSFILVDSLSLWENHVRKNVEKHGLTYDLIVKEFLLEEDLALVIDSVHGASRLHIRKMLDNTQSERFIHLRGEADVTFGGVAPEPSSENMRSVVETLGERSENLKIGAIIDPDGDRIRFTDGTVEISMNQFGAMAYHFLHQHQGKRGLVAKTVATSNLANNLAQQLGEEVFEPRVGFKEFKPVIDRALVCFEESDGISIIGHTPEKDAYIGLLLAIAMVLKTGKNLGEYLHTIEENYGYFYPDRDGIEVSLQGEDLIDALLGLNKYSAGTAIDVGGVQKEIVEIIDIDGRKMILEDGSWLMIRPSGTEPKVRFYVESRVEDGKQPLVDTAKAMLVEVGVIEGA